MIQIVRRAEELSKEWPASFRTRQRKQNKTKQNKTKQNKTKRMRMAIIGSYV